MTTAEARLRFVSERNPIQRVNSEVLDQLVAAQNNLIDHEFQNAAEFCAKVFDDLGLALTVPPDLQDKPVQEIADLPITELTDVFFLILRADGSIEQTARSDAANIAHRAQLLRAFEQPDHVLAQVISKVKSIILTLPHEAEHIQVGRNPGDVLDPYLLTATQILLYGGDFEKAIGATVAHKALMIVEGLMGHLHEDVIGEMRGNVRSPEPRGFNQEMIDPHDNPFPGSDIVQPPSRDGEKIRFHQVKSKTGSAKGGDGKRLGEQLSKLRIFYEAEVYYDALIGNTLRGHRSKSGVLNAEPNAIILVGNAAFTELTRSTIGPELLLRIYQEAFSLAAQQSKYQVDNMATRIVTSFRDRAEDLAREYIELLLTDSIRSNLDEQDSRTHIPKRRSRT